MIRGIYLAFIKLHILHHAGQAPVYGLGLIEALGRHGYRMSPGTLYPTLAKMRKSGLLIAQSKVVNHKQRKYYRLTAAGRKKLKAARRKISELYLEVVEGQ